MKKNTSGSKKNTKKSSSQGNDKTMLRAFFYNELKDIYWAEKHLLKALVKYEKAATTEELADEFSDHLEITERHVSRLEDVFSILGEKAQARKCEAMEGLTKEGDTILEITEDGSLTRDVGLIFAAQKIEHYEIATYGCLVQLARTLGESEVAGILEETLREEKETDQSLTDIAEEHINEDAFVQEGELESAEEE